MLSALAIGTARLASAETGQGSDPGLLGLALRAVAFVRERRQQALEARVAAFIEANGSYLSDDIERRIGSGALSGEL